MENTNFYICKVLQFTAKRALEILERIKPGLSKGDTTGIDHIVPHQPSLQGLMLMSQSFKWPKEKIVTTLEKFGNVMSASIPLTLYEAIKEKKCVKRGDTILIAGTGKMTFHCSYCRCGLNPRWNDSYLLKNSLLCRQGGLVILCGTLIRCNNLTFACFIIGNFLVNNFFVYPATITIKHQTVIMELVQRRSM